MALMKSFKVILFYKYLPISDVEDILNKQKDICTALGLMGRIIIAGEGINGTLEGTDKAIQKYSDKLAADPRFADIHLKISEGTGKVFPKLSIKVRDEIVAGHFGNLDVKPWEITGKYVTPEQLHNWIGSGREFYIVDMRNDFEQAVGNFGGSILPGMKLFRDLPKVMPKLAHLKNKTIVTVCTGGVRCEKASGFLIKHGFDDVWQLHGGIVSYMEKYPNEDFYGSLYVFDQRIVMSFGGKEHKTIGRCAKCGKQTESYINCKVKECNRHFLACAGCSGSGLKCPQGCIVKIRLQPRNF